MFNFPETVAQRFFTESPRRVKAQTTAPLQGRAIQIRMLVKIKTQRVRLISLGESTLTALLRNVLLE